MANKKVKVDPAAADDHTPVALDINNPEHGNLVVTPTEHPELHLVSVAREVLGKQPAVAEEKPVKNTKKSK